MAVTIDTNGGENKGMGHALFIGVLRSPIGAEGTRRDEATRSNEDQSSLVVPVSMP